MKTRKRFILLFSILCLLPLVVVPQAVAENFTIVAIPDTQNHLSGFSTLTNWIVTNKDAGNIVFVAHMGDVVNTCGNQSDYVTADFAIDALDAGSVPYGVSPGNHDQPGSGTCNGTSYFPTYFGASRYSGGAYPEGYYQGSLDNYNHYFFFSAGGMDFIIFTLQYSPETNQFNWANDLMAANPDRRAIVVSHNIIDYNNNWVRQTTYTNLSANPNLFLMLCGHMHTGSDGEGVRTETRTGMQPVHIVMSDYQDMAGNMLRILTFDPDNDIITVEHSQGTGSTFNLAYDMSPRLAGDINGDCDVDGSDLAELIADSGLAGLEDFAFNFGENVCP